MPDDYDALVRRVEQLEDQLRGDTGEPIDLRSLPLTRLQNHLEAEWLPSAPRLIEPKSITAQEIGLLPSAVMSTATDDGVATTQLIASGVVTWLRFKDIEDDTLGIQAAKQFVPSPAAAYSSITCRQPGMYLCSAGGEFNVLVTSTHANMEIRLGRAGTAAGAETSIAINHIDFNASGGFSGVPGFNLSRLIRLYENDHIVATVSQDSGAGKTFGTPTAKAAFLSMTWVSA